MFRSHSRPSGSALRLQKMERGVYWSLATKNGHHQAFAVDSHGDEVERIVLDDNTWRRAEAAVEWLWALLDSVDPVSESRSLVLIR